MTLEAWRICKPKYTPSAFDGEGASRSPGRWNHRGQRLVYAADTQSLALLELLVHSSMNLVKLYCIIPCWFDEGLVETLDPSSLPVGWRTMVDPSWAPLQDIGGDWINSMRSAVLRVPTAIVPNQLNYLINPRHPDFTKIKIGTAIDYQPDPRL
jgi:RES domain-containing protein